MKTKAPSKNERGFFIWNIKNLFYLAKVFHKLNTLEDFRIF